MGIDATSILEQIRKERQCVTAANYYKQRCRFLSDYSRAGEILNQGAADFDQKYDPADD